MPFLPRGLGFSQQPPPLHLLVGNQQASKPHCCLRLWEAGATRRACLLKLQLIGFYSIALEPALSLLNGREERRQEAADHSWEGRLGQWPLWGK